jgi:hypothetical protein
LVVAWESETFMVLKQFKNENYYEEKNNYLSIQKKAGAKIDLLRQFIIPLDSYEDNTL